MIIIGCDFHPSAQMIAWKNTGNRRVRPARTEA